MEVEWLGAGIDYADALARQERRAAAVAAGEAPECLWLLEHAPVYTIGRQRDQSSLRDRAALPYAVFEIQRGGQATYHGPGQLVGYPILDLRVRGRDLHRHLRGIEQALIDSCAALGIEACRRQGFTGVWTAAGKLASIGVGIRKWVSLHGFALNVAPSSLPPFLAITPCGLDGVAMTCLAAEAGRPFAVREVAGLVAGHFTRVFGEGRREEEVAPWEPS